MRYKCKCTDGWNPTKPGSLIEQLCFICNGKGHVDMETAEAYNISTKKKNEFKVKKIKKSIDRLF